MTFTRIILQIEAYQDSSCDYYVFYSLESLHFKKCKEFGEREYYPLFKGVLPGSFDKVYLDQH